MRSMSRGRRTARLLGALGIALCLVFLVVATATAQTHPMRWHRLNPGDPPEHERLSCLYAGDTVRCRYDKLPERDLGFHWDRTRGVFTGTDVTESWECPEWFPESICDSVVSVATGEGTYFPEGSDPFTVGEDLIITSTDEGQILWVYWHDQFVCPWFPTFEEAIAANPSGESDCVFAP
jgi:hypothetical protein